MSYTKDQHVLSQWMLRNFRSDDTAKLVRDKKRVWTHTIYYDEKKGNIIKNLPLPISSVGMKKDCFTLLDGETGVKFDIENELSIYEKKTSDLFNSIVKDHDFLQLLNVEGRDYPLEMLLNFIVIQFVLNLQNPQNKLEYKEEIFEHYTASLIRDFDHIKQKLENPPPHFAALLEGKIYTKIIKVINSSSPKKDICETLLILFMVAESEGLPTLMNFLPTLRNNLFKNIHIEGIYHTGYEFDAIGPRPVFTLGPNIMCYDREKCLVYLPLSHNFAIHFSIGKREFYNSSINIFSADPSKLTCIKNKRINIYKVSHDYIDNITSIINLFNTSHSNTIYTPHCLQDVKDYLALQESNEDFYYSPEKPTLVLS
ncbi:DUF4238 domain-containing protein [Pseudoalteromonas sp. NCIMB_1079]|uniref:DUF4238 domain-containing protein n=1 Tax=Pseudoalteromonas sp. NCIMB 1079 TaxID=3142847 RepID=UPI00339C989E